MEPSDTTIQMAFVAGLVFIGGLGLLALFGAL